MLPHLVVKTQISFECFALQTKRAFGVLHVEATMVAFRGRTLTFEIQSTSIRSIDVSAGSVTVTYVTPGVKKPSAVSFTNFVGGTARTCANAIEDVVSAAAPASNSTEILLEDDCHVVLAPHAGRGTLRRTEEGLAFSGAFSFACAYGALADVTLVAGRTISVTFRKPTRANTRAALITPVRRARRWTTELQAAVARAAPIRSVIAVRRL